MEALEGADKAGGGRLEGGGDIRVREGADLGVRG